LGIAWKRYKEITVVTANPPRLAPTSKRSSLAKLQWLCLPFLHGRKNLQVIRIMSINRGNIGRLILRERKTGRCDLFLGCGPGSYLISFLELSDFFFSN
jgi:hypothetical protein